MVTRKYFPILYYVIGLLFCSPSLFGQIRLNNITLSDSYCVNEVGKNIGNDKKSIKSLLDTVYLSYQNIGDKLLVFEIINTSADTFYLFSSYLRREKYTASCLQRIDEENLEYKVSFTPLLPLLGIRTSDTKIISPESICNPYQTIYDFIKLPPNTFFGFEINVEKLFERTLNKEQVFTDFNPYTVSKFDKNIDFNKYDYNELSKCLDLIFEVAIYRNIDLICNDRAFYLDEFEFDKQSKEFNIYKINVGSSYFKKKLP